MNDNQITASFTQLLEQASMTAKTYMCAARVDIDKEFGDGYSYEHPELVAAYMQTAASDYNTAASQKVWQGIMERVCDGMDQDIGAVSYAVDELKQAIVCIGEAAIARLDDPLRRRGL
jgi:hypothetical protein